MMDTETSILDEDPYGALSGGREYVSSSSFIQGVTRDLISDDYPVWGAPRKWLATELEYLNRGVQPPEEIIREAHDFVYKERARNYYAKTLWKMSNKPPAPLVDLTKETPLTDMMDEEPYYDGYHNPVDPVRPSHIF